MDEGRPQTDLRHYWLALLRSPGSAAPALVTYLHSGAALEALFSFSSRDLAALGFSAAMAAYLRRPDWPGVERDMRWLDTTGDVLVPLTSEDYPPLLKEIRDPPAALFVRGSVAALRDRQLGIVGSRNPTADGRRMAYRFAGKAGDAGLSVTSGLAVGIDSCAHRGAIAAGARTLAVLGNGLDVTYPRRNRRLADDICAHGALVSEFPVGYSPLPAHFPQRNRIISGLSAGVLVVEAARRSGSLSTAAHAANQGREVFAIPSNIANPMARGCHALIRDGAKLVERIEDIIEETGPLSACTDDSGKSVCTAHTAIEGLDESSKLLLDNIGFQPANVDFLVESTGLPASVAVSALSSLEISGLVDSLPGGNYVRRHLTSQS